MIEAIAIFLLVSSPSDHCRILQIYLLYRGCSVSGRRHRRPVVPSAAIALAIKSLSHEGRGIGHIGGKVAFVDGALPGEEVTALYIRSRSQLDELRVETVLVPSAERVKPGCEYAGVCGGCSLQHMHTKAQIEFKQQMLLEQLDHVAHVTSADFRLLPILQASTYRYRRKARLAVRMVMKKGGALVGFREKYSSFITDMDDCQILHANVATLITPLRLCISQLRGSHAIPQIEVAVGEKTADEPAEANAQVALVFRHLEPLHTEDLQALISFSELHKIDLYLQPGGAESVHKVYPANDVERLAYYLPEYDLQMVFHPLDFTQINGAINRQIVAQALKLLELESSDTVLDLFCGLGNFTLPIARNCLHVIGVEGSEEMVARGTENARLNKISNAEFFAANLCESFADKHWAKARFTKILLDPPRSGAIEIIPELVSLRASRIVYISCNPATLARDAAALTGAGYKLTAAGVMDMFPHTTHVESMAVFELIDRKAR